MGCVALCELWTDQALLPLANRVQGLALFHSDLVKLKDVLALFRNFVPHLAGASPVRRACTLSSSAMAWFSCQLIMASYRNNLSRSSFSGKKR
jgi:hypothetical protein